MRCHVKVVRDLQGQLSRLKASKDARGRVSEEWLVRVILTAPNVRGRAMSEAFHLARNFIAVQRQAATGAYG